MNAIVRLTPFGCPAGVDPRTWRQAIEAQLNDLLDRAMSLITALDLMEADREDLEDGADDEPYLGGWSGYNDDREADTSDHEDDGTAEPSLGALNRVCQVPWAAGSRSDREEDAGDTGEVLAYGD
ncbi:hypothetical protein [Mesorhizobium sp. AA23]|uniref:hypothetical protein n=1 Tax=Mesorhizobium sp. AA23 TaxID=1854058 RepID=UPI000801BD87|nr:hypothetical protein [Mesorhizobium sp. AA23]OBQ96036.1 hypothetical protein A9K66_22835 [Mesorhizobium sp. AA23]